MPIPFRWPDLALWLLYAGVYTVPAGLAAVLIVFGVPSLRHRRFARVIAFVCLFAASTCPLGGVVLLGEMITAGPRADADLRHRTHQVDEPRVIAGTRYPPGSTLLLSSKGDEVESGVLSQPTVLRGLPLVGAFELSPASPDSPPGASGTLAADTVVDTVPCAGHENVNYTSAFLGCRLSRNVQRDGLLLAQGTYVQLRNTGPGGSFALEQGAVAEPTMFFDMTYPAHTIVVPLYQGGKPTDGLLADKLAHLPRAGQAESAQICLAPGAIVTLFGAELHGPMQLQYSPDSISVSAGCTWNLAGIPGSSGEDQGYGVLGPKQFKVGKVQPSAHSWTSTQRTMTGDE